MNGGQGPSCTLAHLVAPGAPASQQQAQGWSKSPVSASSSSLPGLRPRHPHPALQLAARLGLPDPEGTLRQRSDGTCQESSTWTALRPHTAAQGHCPHSTRWGHRVALGLKTSGSTGSAVPRPPCGHAGGGQSMSSPYNCSMRGPGGPGPLTPQKSTGLASGGTWGH